MPEFHGKEHVIILCDSWYTKQNLVSIVDEYPNLDLIGNARIDSVMYDPAPARTGRRGRPAKHGKQLSVETDFTLSNKKIGDYYTGVRRVLTKIFRENGTEKQSFCTMFFFSDSDIGKNFSVAEDLQIFCAWQEKAPLNQTGSDRMKYIPLLLYSFRWNIETSYYEQKTFWSFCNYMVRSCKGIEMLVNLINISYCAMKILPYQNEHFSEYRTKSVQEFRFELSQGIRSQIFFATFVKNIETHIKSNAMTKALKQLICQQVYHLKICKLVIDTYNTLQYNKSKYISYKGSSLMTKKITAIFLASYARVSTILSASISGPLLSMLTHRQRIEALLYAPILT